MRRTDFDAVVVGAGIGGAGAAYYLTQAGLRTLVVEKVPLPRYKACGGAIPRTALERFPFDFDSVIRAAPSDVRFTFPNLTPVDIHLPDRPVVMVMRSEFDAFLLSHAEAEIMAGAAVTRVTESDDRVTVEAGGRRFTARYLVGADGATSTVARHLDLRSGRQFGAALEAEVPFNDDSFVREEYSQRALFALGAIDWGYGWVFSKDDGLSVGIGRIRPGRAHLASALRQEMAHLGIGLEGVKLHGHPLPCYQAPPWPFWRGQPQERLSTRRCLLVGDAAGLVDPLIGEGMRYAITSARLASEAIANGDLSGYEAAIWQAIGHSLATSGLAASTYYRAPRQCYQLGVRNPAVVRELVDVLAERFSYEGIGRRLWAATFRWLLAGQQAGRGGAG